MLWQNVAPHFIHIKKNSWHATAASTWLDSAVHTISAADTGRKAPWLSADWLVLYCPAEILFYSRPYKTLSPCYQLIGLHITAVLHKWNQVLFAAIFVFCQLIDMYLHAFPLVDNRVVSASRQSADWHMYFYISLYTFCYLACWIIQVILALAICLYILAVIWLPGVSCCLYSLLVKQVLFAGAICLYRLAVSWLAGVSCCLSSLLDNPGSTRVGYLSLPPGC